MRRQTHFVLFFSLLTFFFTPGRVSAMTLYDDFNDNDINIDRWTYFTNSSQPTLEEVNGRIEMSLPATSEDGPGGVFGAWLESRCRLKGDFDIQTDYQLLEWPEANGVRIGLGLNLTNLGYITFAERVSFGGNDLNSPSGRETYLADFGPGGIHGIVDTTDQSGKLRILRNGSNVSGYYWSSDKWSLIHQREVSTDDIEIILAAWSHNWTFADKRVSIAFDNLVINEGELVDCPAPQITPTPTVILFKQNDPRWKDNQYAFETGSCSTIEKCGCALSTIAMTLNSHGANKDPLTGDQTTPETVNTYFKLNPKPFKCKDVFGNLYNGFVSKGYVCGQVNWSTTDNYSSDAYKKFGTQKILWLTKKNDQIWNKDIVIQDVSINNPVILRSIANI